MTDEDMIFLLNLAARKAERGTLGYVKPLAWRADEAFRRRIERVKAESRPQASR